MIKSYSVANFKSYAALDMAFSGANVLTGLNGSGKSTLVQPLLLARQSAMNGSLEHGRLTLNGPLTSIGTGQDMMFEFAEVERTTFRWDDVEIDIPYQADESELDVSVAGTLDDALPPFALMTYISNARIPPQGLYERFRKYETPSPIAGASGEEAPGYLAARANITMPGERSMRDQGASGTLLEQVNYWVNQISPGVSVKTDEFHQLDGVVLRFTFDGKAGVPTRPYRAANVGFGLSHSLSIVTALVAAPAGALLVIEAPEANLHPRAQLRLGHLIGQAAGDGVQVIVETHSPHIVTGLARAVSSGWLPRKELTLHYCVRDDAETRVAHVQVNQAGRLAHIGGYEEIPDEYYHQFLLL